MYYMFFFYKWTCVFFGWQFSHLTGQLIPSGASEPIGKFHTLRKRAETIFIGFLGRCSLSPCRRVCFCRLCLRAEEIINFLSLKREGLLERELIWRRGGGLNRGFTVLPRVIICLICCRWETHVKIWSHWWLDWYLWRTQRSSMERYINWRCHKGSHWCSWLHSVCSGHNI